MSLSENPKNPSCTVHLHESKETSLEHAEKTMRLLERTRLRDVVEKIQICFDPDDASGEDAELLEEFHAFERMVDGCLDQTDPSIDTRSKWIIRMEMSVEDMLDRSLTMDDVNFAIKNAYQDDVECVYSDYNDDNLIFRIRMMAARKRKEMKSIETQSPLDQSDEIYMLKKFQDQLLDGLILRGVKDIGRVIPRKVTDSLHEKDGKYVKQESWVLDTVGTNLMDILAIEEIDSNRTFTNDIQEIHRTLGIEAARQAIFNEISDVIEFDSTYINYHHLSILCDRMTCNDRMVSIFRHGINNDDIGPIAKASFEETPEMFLKAARHAELDPMRGVSANVMCGQPGYFGTSAFQVMLDLDKRAELNTKQWTAANKVEDLFGGMFSGPCGDIAIQSNVQHTRALDNGAANDEYELSF
jgi:DNA-directed RNA polymerase II subunit RPB1